MRSRAEKLLDGFLPAMEKIQAMPIQDDEKKRLAKEWLRAKLDEMTSKNQSPPGEKLCGGVA